MSSPATERAVPVVGGAGLRLALPEGASPEPPGELPAIDVANLPGASVPLRLGFRSGALTLRATCATAPSRGWAPGVEELVLARATAIARGALGGEVERLTAGEVERSGPRFEQRFEGALRRDGEAFAARGRHWLGFAGEARAGVLCTVACVEPERSSACGALVDAAVTEGAWIEAPPPSALVRAILLAAEHPPATAAIAGALLFAAAALVIARRPRPRA
jgi:hypothetical protein